MGHNQTEVLRAENQARPMLGFIVTVRRTIGPATFPAIGTDSAAVLIAALDRFGICAVTVKPARAAA